MAHHAHTDAAGEKKSKTALRSAFWLTAIIVGLFIATVSFIQVMGDSHEGEEVGGASHHTMQATSNQTMADETGVGAPATDTTQAHDPAGDEVHSNMPEH